MDKLEQLYEKALSRRKFVAGASALGAVTAIAGCNDSSGPIITTTTATPTTTPTPTTTTTPVTTTPTPRVLMDSDILNFALNLEYLEAQFYLYAATGAGLAVADTGAGTSTTGSGAGMVILPAGMTGAQLKVTGTNLQNQILAEIAFDEQSHVRLLRSALGTAAVAMPQIDLSFFGPLAMAATITTVATGTGSFTPFGGAFDAFLIGAFIFEDVGVTAYSGAAPLISAAGDTNGTLLTAAGILAVEAYHAAYVRTTITGNAIAAAAAGTAYPYLGYANKVATLRSTLGGGMETQLTLPTATGTTFTPSAIVAATTANAIAFARTTDQVLHIVYGNAAVGTKSGGFFPVGTNGFISATTT